MFLQQGGQNREKKGALPFTIAELLREGRIGPLKTTYPVHGSARVNLNFEVLERYALLDADFSPLNDPFLFYSIIIYILVILLYDTISRLEISLHRLTAAAGITVRVRPWQSERINRYDMTDTMILAALLLILATGYLQTAQRNFR